MLREKLIALETQRAEVENQDIDAYVVAKLKELEPKIRAEAEQSQAYELKVLDIRIDAFKEAVAIVEAQNAVVEEVPEQETIE